MVLYPSGRFQPNATSYERGKASEALVRYGLLLASRRIVVEGMWRRLLRPRLFLDPLRIARFVVFLPQFLRVFVALMRDHRVPVITKMLPFTALLLLLSPPALELDLIPFLGELDVLLVGYLTLRLFVWLCPPEVVREHVARIARGA